MRFLIVLILGFGLLFSAQVYADLRSDLLIEGGTSAAISWIDETSVNFRDNFFAVAQNYIIGLLALIAVGVFLYTGFRLLMADGKEEEHKKAWLSLIYVGVGLAIVPLAYVAVRIVLGFNFS